MSATSYEDLLAHRGHKIVIAVYGDESEPENVAIECEDCYEVLMDFDRPKRGSR